MAGTDVKILVGICSMRENDKFFASVSDFIKQCKGKYHVDVIVKKWTPLPDAQNYIADCFLLGGYDYLLLLDDDHDGHTVDMLDALIAANTYMATIKTHSRHYPYVTALWKWVDGLNDEGKCFVGIEDGEGYQTVDMTGFPMTLLRRDLFHLLDRPFFQPKSYGGVEWATDRFFCERLAKIGIKPVGVFTHCLNHDGITKDNVQQLRYKERMSEKQKIMLIVEDYKKRITQKGV